VLVFYLRIKIEKIQEAVFAVKTAIFIRQASSHYPKIDGFLRETSNTSADSTVCTASECYEVFAEKAAILPFFDVGYTP
jgi:hypothetical protein